MWAGLEIPSTLPPVDECKCHCKKPMCEWLRRQLLKEAPSDHPFCRNKGFLVLNYKTQWKVNFHKHPNVAAMRYACARRFKKTTYLVHEDDGEEYWALHHWSADQIDGRVWKDPYPNRAAAQKFDDAVYKSRVGRCSDSKNEMVPILARLDYPEDIQKQFEGMFVKAPVNSTDDVLQELAKYMTATSRALRARSREIVSPPAAGREAPLPDDVEGEVLFGDDDEDDDDDVVEDGGGPGFDDDATMDNGTIGDATMDGVYEEHERVGFRTRRYAVEYIVRATLNSYHGCILTHIKNKTVVRGSKDYVPENLRSYLRALDARISIEQPVQDPV
jgi:hypothetical protein